MIGNFTEKVERKMKKIVIVLFVLGLGLVGCAGQQWTQKESDQMLQIKKECKWQTIQQAKTWTHPEAGEEHWNDILAVGEYRDFYERCLKNKGYQK